MLHITLHYIGHCDETTLSVIKENIGALSFQSFQTKSLGLDMFKKHQKKKLIYLNILNNQALKKCHNQVIDKLMASGLDISPYPYHPHVTLARKAEVHVTDVDSIKVQSHSIVVDAIHIMESKRVDDRLVYESLAHVILKS